MDKIKEVDLFPAVKNLFQSMDYEVSGEVNHCDVVARINDEIIIVELKKNINVTLLVQAVNRQKMTDLVYIAIPKPKKSFGNKKWNDLCHLIRRLELGLIVVTFLKKLSYAEVVFEPKPFDRKKSQVRNKRRKKQLIEELDGRSLDVNVGGSTNKKLMTAYKESALFIAYVLSEKGPLSPKVLRSFNTDPTKTTSILYNNFYGWYKRERHGIYAVSDKGKEALDNFKQIVDIFKEDIRKSEINVDK